VRSERGGGDSSLDSWNGVLGEGLRTKKKAQGADKAARDKETGTPRVAGTLRFELHKGVTPQGGTKGGEDTKGKDKWTGK